MSFYRRHPHPYQCQRVITSAAPKKRENAVGFLKGYVRKRAYCELCDELARPRKPHRCSRKGAMGSHRWPWCAKSLGLNSHQHYNHVLLLVGQEKGYIQILYSWLMMLPPLSSNMPWMVVLYYQGMKKSYLAFQNSQELLVTFVHASRWLKCRDLPCLVDVAMYLQCL